MNGIPGWEPVGDLLKTVSALQTTTRVEIPLHNYYPVCPSYNLIDADGRYCGVPDIRVCAPCFPMISTQLRREFSDIEAWRDAWDAVIRRADRVTAFSSVSSELLSRAFPSARVTVAPHSLTRQMRTPSYSLRRSIAPRVAIFGHIEPAKGSEMLVEMATLAAREGRLIEWHVFGTLTPDTGVRAIKVHGPYDVEEMPDLLEEHGVVAAVIPSICAETFSYVAEELAHMRVPFSAFALGAPFERFHSDENAVFAHRVTPEDLLSATLAAIELGWARFDAPRRGTTPRDAHAFRDS